MPKPSKTPGPYSMRIRANSDKLPNIAAIMDIRPPAPRRNTIDIPTTDAQQTPSSSITQPQNIEETAHPRAPWQYSNYITVCLSLAVSHWPCGGVQPEGTWTVQRGGFEELTRTPEESGIFEPPRAPEWKPCGDPWVKSSAVRSDPFSNISWGGYEKKKVEERTWICERGGCKNAWELRMCRKWCGGAKKFGQEAGTKMRDVVMVERNGGKWWGDTTFDRVKLKRDPVPDGSVDDQNSVDGQISSLSSGEGEGSGIFVLDGSVSSGGSRWLSGSSIFSQMSRVFQSFIRRNSRSSVSTDLGALESFPRLQEEGVPAERAEEAERAEARRDENEGKETFAGRLARRFSR